MGKDSEVLDEKTESVVLENEKQEVAQPQETVAEQPIVHVEEPVVKVEESTIISEEPAIAKDVDYEVSEELEEILEETESDEYLIALGSKWLKSWIPYAVTTEKDEAVVLSHEKARAYLAVIKLRKRIIGEIIKA